MCNRSEVQVLLPTTYKSADLGSSPTARGLEWSAVGCLVGVAQLVDRMCGKGKEVGNDFTPRNQCAGSIPATNNPFLKGQA